jgi:AraC-like DNA-binding protein
VTAKVALILCAMTTDSRAAHSGADWTNATAAPRLSGTVGILAPDAVGDIFQLERFRPAADLAPFVENFWRVSWDRRGLAPHTQEVLPYPNVHAIVELGVSSVTGVLTGRFTRELRGRGQAFGVKFRPGGFRPFSAGPIAALTDRRLELGRVFELDARALERELLACPEAAAMAARVEAVLRGRAPCVDATVDLVDGVVQYVATHRALQRVDELVVATGLSKRVLQRLFREYVGVSPKWVIQRFRLHDAAARLAAGESLDAAQLARELGYFDQAHFIRDFRATVGRPPGAYARAVRGPD